MKLVALTLALASLGAQAGTFCTHEPCPPDNWGGARGHVALSAGIGGLTYALAPESRWWAQLALCELPGLAREVTQRSEPGNRFSMKDVAANTLGCGLGLAGAHGLRVALTPGSVQLSYSVSLP